MLDLLIVLAFVAYSVTVGLRARARASKNLEEYFLAGRSVRGWQAGFSMAATQYAADTPLLVAGLIATGGVFTLWRLWIYGLAFLTMGFVLGRCWRRSGVLTDAELVEIRYSGGVGVPLLRGLKAIYFGTVINCTVLAMVLVAATRICEVFLPWHEWLPEAVYDPVQSLVVRVGVPLASGLSGVDTFVATTNNLFSIFAILLFVALYSTTGGLRGVVATDLAQFALAMVATLLYAVFAVRAAGGLGEMLDNLASHYGDVTAGRMLAVFPPAGEAVMPFLVIVGLQWFFQMNSDGTGYLAQRTMACRSDRDAGMAGFIFTWAQVFLRSALWLPIGIALLVLYPFDPAAGGGEALTASREILFVTGIQDLLPIGVRGLMLTGMLAALASTLDTHLNWGASYWSNDLYKGLLSERILKRRPRSREMVLVARLSNIVILGIAVVIMANLASIKTAWETSLLFGAGIGSVLVLRWLWERINLWSEIAAIVTSIVVAPILLLTVDAEWLKLSLMAATSTAAVVAVSWLTPPTAEERLDEFYRRVQPPGWWPATARRTGDDAGRPGRRLATGSYLVVTTAVSVFLLLIGVAKAMLPQPGRSPTVGFVLIGLSLLSVVAWWRRVGAVGKRES